ncbi:I78 family peptidase inhibitor [Allosphingosinicella sp.]|jgi:hypothetical protein|uniref:I78 family peptidase inhibitor n=1 Tax=Allosphingosinicella sp. TaxID=2823234 RepID=UPI002F245ED9
MIGRLAFLASAMASAACTTPPLEENGLPSSGTASCNADSLGDLVGRQRSEALGAEALRRSGAATLRWIPPDAVITQDLRSDRINVDLDSRGRVTGLRCF